MNAEIVATGTELLLGEIVDTNSARIARRLRDIGVNVYFKTTVGDNLERIASALDIALSRADIVITTGGLGPTVDDVTRDAVARVSGCPMQLDERQLERIGAMFSRWDRRMSANNRRQAYLPAGCIVIDNEVGTAPGSIVEGLRGGVIISIPGVPREMEYMMEHSVLPYLRERMEKPEIIVAKVLRTVGIGESLIDEKLDDLMHLANPTVGLAAHSGQTDVRITAKAQDETTALGMIAEVEKEVCSRLGEFIYGKGKETVEEVAARVLAQRGWHVSVVETNTRGEVARRLAATLDGEKVLTAAWTISEEAMEWGEIIVSLAGKEDGRYTSEEAKSIAVALRERTGADVGLALLGTLSSEDGIYGKSAGETHIALATASGVEHLSLSFGGTDDYTARWIGNRALDWLRRVAIA